MSENAKQALKLPDLGALTGIADEIGPIIDAATRVADWVVAHDNVPLVSQIAGPAQLIDTALHALGGLVHEFE
jgi:hypothetical protein